MNTRLTVVRSVVIAAISAVAGTLLLFIINLLTNGFVSNPQSVVESTWTHSLLSAVTFGVQFVCFGTSTIFVVIAILLAHRGADHKVSDGS